MGRTAASQTGGRQIKSQHTGVELWKGKKYYGHKGILSSVSFVSSADFSVNVQKSLCGQRGRKRNHNELLYFLRSGPRRN